MTIDSAPRRKLVGLAGDHRSISLLVWLLVGQPGDEGFDEVATRDRARDLVMALQPELAGSRIDDLLESEGWTSLLAGDRPEALLADRMVETAHAAFVDVMPAGALCAEIEAAINSADPATPLVVSDVDTIEIADLIRRLGGHIVWLEPERPAGTLSLPTRNSAVVDLVVTVPRSGRLTGVMRTITEYQPDQPPVAA